jgi:hypothetical protein
VVCVPEHRGPGDDVAEHQPGQQTDGEQHERRHVVLVDRQTGAEHVGGRDEGEVSERATRVGQVRGYGGTKAGQPPQVDAK